ncbi:MAG: ATP-binding protein [Clostridiales bacterium]|nr:ATP-binding protein [Clostridiales bacterium]
MVDVAQYFPTGRVLEIKENDYQDENGLWHCGVCGKAKQKRIDVEKGSFRLHRTVWCLCDCEAEKLKKKQDRIKHEEEMRRISRLKDASMMSSKFRKVDFSQYKVREENKKAYHIARKYTGEFRQMVREGNPRTGEKNIGFVFYGPCGTGKSFTAACIANSLLEQGISVIMTSFVKILQDIQNAGYEAEYINTLNSCSLLIIDDLGAERNTDYALEKVYNIIDSRVRTDKPMILTTNLSFDEMMRNPDIRYRRIYDRIFEHCIPVEIPGNSFRIQKAAERQKNLSRYYEED